MGNWTSSASHEAKISKQNTIEIQISCTIVVRKYRSNFFQIIYPLVDKINQEKQQETEQDEIAKLKITDKMEMVLRKDRIMWKKLYKWIT